MFSDDANYTIYYLLIRPGVVDLGMIYWYDWSMID